MANPTWITSENIKFDGTTTNAAVLKTVGSNKTLIEWDTLSTEDKNILTDFIDTYGGTLPLVGPTTGSQTIAFAAAIVGTDTTGLDNTAAATAGVATINIGGNKLAGDASGLSSVVGTQGYQIVNFAPTIVGTDVTNLVPTAGYQDATFSVAKAGADATGLANDATAYTATITVDGTAKAISIVGSAAQTFTTLLAELDTDLGGVATATIVGGNIRITSATLGTTSTVDIVDGTLFAALTDFTAIATAVIGTKSTAALTATITVDGVDKAISILPAAITTFADVITEINADLGASAVASISGGDIKIISNTSGATSTVIIVPGTLFATLPGFLSVTPAVAGKSTGRLYSATIVIDQTTVKTVSFMGTAGDTVQHVIDEINADLGVTATAALTGGNITITSATTGVSSSVNVYDSGFLFGSLTGYVGITSVEGVAPKTYTAIITVDGVDKAISIVGNAAQTFTDLVTQLNTDLGVSAIASISNGAIKISSATSGTSSKVLVKDGTLFRALGVKSFSQPIDGITDILEAAKQTRTPNGSTVYSHFQVKEVGVKPSSPQYVPYATGFTSAVYNTDGTLASAIIGGISYTFTYQYGRLTSVVGGGITKNYTWTNGKLTNVEVL